MKTSRIFVPFLAILVAMLACQFGTGEPTPTPTPDLGPEQTGTAEALNRRATSVERTAESVATNEAQAALDAQSTIDAQSTTDAAAEAKAAEETQSAMNSQATRTQRVYDQQTATAEALLQQTAQAEPIFLTAQGLVDEGMLTDSDGVYETWPDFDETWAQLNWYRRYEIPKASIRPASRYLISAHVWWESASDYANWNLCGCGFVFGHQADSGNHHVATISMDGYANLFRSDASGTFILAKRSGDAKGVPQGEADFMLVVDGQKIGLYVNGQQVVKYTDTRLKPGQIYYTLISGTNKGYGTHCKMTEVNHWLME